MRMPESHFDEWIARRYEILWPELFDPAVVDPVVDFLAHLAGTGPALELGIGTGRIGLPLSRRGVRVHGIELSPAMVVQLQMQPGASEIDVTVGDFATVKAGGPFRLVYLLRNTITTSPPKTNRSRHSATSRHSCSQVAVSSSRTTSPSFDAYRPANPPTSSQRRRPILATRSTTSRPRLRSLTTTG